MAGCEQKCGVLCGWEVGDGWQEGVRECDTLQARVCLKVLHGEILLEGAAFWGQDLRVLESGLPPLHLNLCSRFRTQVVKAWGGRQARRGQWRGGNRGDICNTFNSLGSGSLPSLPTLQPLTVVSGPKLSTSCYKGVHFPAEATEKVEKGRQGWDGDRQMMQGYTVWIRQ